MKSKSTDDEILARGDVWHGPVRDLRERMSNFTVDGTRFGTLSPETRSGSRHDRRLTKRSEEIVTAVFILGRLGYSHVQLLTKTHDGIELERPDLDATLDDGSTVGLEVAQVGSTTRMRHDSHIASLEHTIRDLIETDESFAKAFGPYYLTVSLSSVLAREDVQSKRDALAMTDEVITFIRAGEHAVAEDHDNPETGYFDRKYTTLCARGATFYSSPAGYGPYFGVMTGGTVNPNAETGEVMRVLNDHRKSAHTYRGKRLWLLLYLSDSNEFFRNTVAEVAALRPDIAPFERCHMTDACWHLATIP